MKLFVGNLSFDTQDADLKTLFTQAGTCVSAVVVMDRTTGRSRGFGFVEMATAEDGQRAMSQLNGSSLQGRAISVSEPRERGAARPSGFSERPRSFGPDLPPAGGAFRKSGKSRRGARGRKRGL